MSLSLTFTLPLLRQDGSRWCTWSVRRPTPCHHQAGRARLTLTLALALTLALNLTLTLAPIRSRLGEHG